MQGNLAAGHEYTLAVKSNWEGKSIGATKSIIITELGNYGGKDPFLANILLGAALVSLVCICAFVAFYFRKLHGIEIYSKEFALQCKYS